MRKLFLYISDVSIRWDGKNLYGLIDKEIKGKCEVKKWSGLTKHRSEITK